MQSESPFPLSVPTLRTLHLAPWPEASKKPTTTAVTAVVVVVLLAPGPLKATASLAGRPSYQALGLLLQRSNVELQSVALHAQVELICLLPQTISPKMGKALVAVINSCWLPGPKWLPTFSSELCAGKLLVDLCFGGFGLWGVLILLWALQHPEP